MILQSLPRQPRVIFPSRDPELYHIYKSLFHLRWHTFWGIEQGASLGNHYFACHSGCSFFFRLLAHVCWVGDAIQPSHCLSPPTPTALNFSQHQGLFQWVAFLHHVAEVLSFNFPKKLLTCFKGWCSSLHTLFPLLSSVSLETILPSYHSLPVSGKFNYKMGGNDARLNRLGEGEARVLHILCLL